MAACVRGVGERERDREIGIGIVCEPVCSAVRVAFPKDMRHENTCNDTVDMGCFTNLDSLAAFGGFQLGAVAPPEEND